MYYKDFDNEFYPTPQHVIEAMTEAISLQNKTVLEPSAGKGNIVDFCKLQGAEVIACEKNKDLCSILEKKCRIVKNDFFELTATEVSHIQYIIMNPPFSNGIQHIMHAFKIAPPGCRIVSLLNADNLKYNYKRSTEEFFIMLNTYGFTTDLDHCFEDSERSTRVRVAMVYLEKPGSYEQEFDGFFEEEQKEQQANGIMKYNDIRDLVNRYKRAVILNDLQLEQAIEQQNLTSVFNIRFGFRQEEEEKAKARQTFKIELQKAAWQKVFDIMKMRKFATEGVMKDINRFVEQRKEFPFTMRNIFKMIEIVLGTHTSRMDQAIKEVFENFTRHHHENRYGVEGWKTNSHYLLNKKFIIPHMVEVDYDGWMRRKIGAWYTGEINDLVKVLCYVTGSNYEHFKPFDFYFSGGQKFTFNTWYEWGFFEVKGFKKGTIHVKFQDERVWGLFNQNIARVMGFPLYEYKPKEEKSSDTKNEQDVTIDYHSEATPSVYRPNATKLTERLETTRDGLGIGVGQTHTNRTPTHNDKISNEIGID